MKDASVRGRESHAGLGALAEALASAVAAERAFVTVLDGRRLRFVGAWPETALPSSLSVASRPALCASLERGEAADIGPVRGLGRQSNLVLPFESDGRIIGAVVLADAPLEPETAEGLLAGALPLCAAHLLTALEVECLRNEQSERELLLSALLRMVDVGEEPVRILDLDGRVVFWNPACERLLGWSEAEVIGRQLPSVSREDRSRVLADLRRIADTMRPLERQSVHVRKDGSVLRINVCMHPVVDAEGRFLAVVMPGSVGTDSRVDRMREDFCSLVTSALKSPLSGIVGFTQLLRQDDIAEDIPRRRRVLDALDGHTAQLGKLIDDLLLLGGVEDGALVVERESLDLVGLVTSSVAEFEKDHADRRFVVDVEGRLPRFDGDDARLRQALAHLLSNAVTYSSANGEIWVTVRREHDEALVVVSDRGEGIPDEDLQRVTTEFVRGSQSRGNGAGIGLRVAEVVAEAHGGTLTLVSAQGEGSTVTLRLPLTS